MPANWDNPQIGYRYSVESTKGYFESKTKPGSFLRAQDKYVKNLWNVLVFYEFSELTH